MRTYNAILHETARASLAILGSVAIQLTRAIVVILAISAIQTIRLIRTIRTIQAIHVIRALEAMRGTLASRAVQVVPALQEIRATVATWTIQVVPVLQAMRAIVAARSIRVVPAFQATRATLVTQAIRMIAALQAMGATLASRTIQVLPALQSLRATLAARVIPAMQMMRTTVAAWTIQMISALQTIRAPQLIRVVRTIRAFRVMGATLVPRATLAIQAIRVTLAFRTIRTIRAIQQHSFSSSFAGRAALLAVLVGAAAAYAMPGRLPTLAPTPAPSASVDSFNVRFGSARADVASGDTTGSAAPSLSAAERRPVESRPSGIAPEPPLISAPMVFEAPKPADAQILTELPKTETVVEKSKPAPVRLASLPAEPLPAESPKSVTIELPLPKPPLSPAQRLDLHGKDYDKAEKCLAQAVYFEARNEPARGQQAVAQVVLNRVFSPYYPKDICSVVYQNAHRHLACQFTFACDGKPDRVRERGAWARANRIAVQTLNAKVWLSDVNKSTHYHAAYVRPYWIRDMKTMARYGLHIFYRPRNWGDGSDEAHWDTPSNSVKPAAVASKRGGIRPAKHLSHRRVYRRRYRA